MGVGSGLRCCAIAGVCRAWKGPAAQESNKSCRKKNTARAETRIIIAMLGCTVIGYFCLQPFMAALREAAGPAGIGAASAVSDISHQFAMLHGLSMVFYLANEFARRCSGREACRSLISGPKKTSWRWTDAVLARLIEPPCVTRSLPLTMTLVTDGRLVPLALGLTMVTSRMPRPLVPLRSFSASFFGRYMTSSLPMCCTGAASRSAQIES